MFDVADYREIPLLFRGEPLLMTMKKGEVIYRLQGRAPLHPRGAAARTALRHIAFSRHPAPARGGWLRTPREALPV